MTPNESPIPTETTDTNRTDEQSTDHDGGMQAVAAAVTAREMLQDVDPATVDDNQESHLINALEALDNLFIEASPEELGEAFGGDGPSSYESGMAHPRPMSECPAVPVYFQIPQAAADRAIDMFNRLQERTAEPATVVDLEGYIYDEIEPDHRIYVGDETLAEYAAGGVEGPVEGLEECDERTEDGRGD